MNYSENETIVREGVVSIYQDFCKGDEIYISIGVFYPNLRNWIDQNFNAEIKTEIYNNAKLTYRKREINPFIKVAQQEDEKPLLAQYKKLLVKRCFEICKEKNIQILTIFKQ